MISEITTTTRGATELRRRMAYRRLAAAILGLDPETLLNDLQKLRMSRERSSVRRRDAHSMKEVLA